MIYTIEDVPPWYLCILLGLQVGSGLRFDEHSFVQFVFQMNGKFCPVLLLMWALTRLHNDAFVFLLYSLTVLSEF